MRTLIGVLLTGAILGGCGSRIALSPPQLIGDGEANVAVQEFLLSSQALANAYGMEFTFNPDLPMASGRGDRVNRDLFGFPIREEVPYAVSMKATLPMGRFDARLWYIKAGAYASMILCRNYLSGLRDRNEYFEFLQKEFNVAGGLVNIAMQLSHANDTIRTSVTQGLLAANQGFDAYESFRFLSPEIETILPIVTNAQITLRDYYLREDKVPETFSGAMNAVSLIEYQCTRSGIRSLLNKTLIQGAPQFNVINGILYATGPKPEEKPLAGQPGPDLHLQAVPRSTPPTAAPGTTPKSRDTQNP
ncbi:hypothetical protein [Bradyrhizobium sp. STM 3809]|uniref:hypothetical protein n=1 Tax=Bradyrhizobium sp. STM 3809 TaxID=551936 RepID=UPI0002406085|nr:hypothetical protein [Bradyrhizobium sp. STM 3809]CCD99696.1 exported hypothetical protein [Bradyrhizobium sp. STM 3809]